MDIRLPDASPNADEREAVDTVLGPPRSAWDGGARGASRDAHVAYGGRARREERHLLLPCLQALQMRIGWISKGGLAYVCERLGVPPAEAWAVATFYGLLASGPRPRRVVHVCDDIACRARGAHGVLDAIRRVVGPEIDPARGASTANPAQAGWTRSPCLGLCDRGPAALVTEAGVTPIEVQAAEVDVARVRELLAAPLDTPAASADLRLPQHGNPSLRLLARVGVIDPESLAAYRAAGGYSALARALDMGPDAVIREVTAAKLVGRGGAAFPAGAKWEAVRAAPTTPRYLVCNADESEPGTFKDRVLMCGDPFAVIEAMTIAGFAAGCEKGFVYVRAEYPLASRRMEHAAAAARAAGLLGRDILGRGVDFEIELRRGAGAYVCGEETALFASIEGRRGEPRVKPPFPTEVGLFGKPTVVNNVETLVNVLPIVLEGGAAYARIGTAQSTGTRLFSVSGAVRLPGVYEVPLGTTLRALVGLAGGVPEGRTMRAVLLGGAAGSFIRPDELDIELSLEATRAAGTTLGSAVVMVFDDTIDLRETVVRIARFFREEACGQCVPCRVGTVRQEEALARIASGVPRGSVTTELQLLDEIGAGMREASLCGLGQTAYAAVESAIKRLGLFGPAPPALVLTPVAAPAVPRGAAHRSDVVEVSVDGRALRVAAGTTILEACQAQGIAIPTICHLKTLTPANVCRLCVVEIEGARALAPSCSRVVEPGMRLHTQSPRVRHARKIVLEMLASSVDLSAAPGLQPLLGAYGCDPARFGPTRPAHECDHGHAGHPAPVDPAVAASVAQPVKIDNDLYVRDYAKCVLCYRCVEACGTDHQNSFAIGVAGRGFEARISTEFAVPLPASACVYCGNCIAVCPTGALMAKDEFDLRAAGTYDEARQTTTDTICPYCGVGCTLRLHVQDGRIVKATSPFENTVTLGNLCIKGRFGWRFVNPSHDRSQPA